MDQPKRVATQPHMLVVDDDQDVLDLLADILCEEGYRVTTSPMAFESPADVAAMSPDVLVADLRLGWSIDAGLHFLERLHADPVTSMIPIVICSASHPEVMDAARARLNEQVCALIGKPFDVDALLSAVARCVAGT